MEDVSSPRKVLVGDSLEVVLMLLLNLKSSQPTSFAQNLKAYDPKGKTQKPNSRIGPTRPREIARDFSQKGEGSDRSRIVVKGYASPLDNLRIGQDRISEADSATQHEECSWQRSEVLTYVNQDSMVPLCYFGVFFNLNKLVTRIRSPHSRSQVSSLQVPSPYTLFRDEALPWPKEM